MSVLGAYIQSALFIIALDQHIYVLCSCVLFGLSLAIIVCIVIISIIAGIVIAKYMLETFIVLQKSSK